MTFFTSLNDPEPVVDATVEAQSNAIMPLDEQQRFFDLVAAYLGFDSAFYIPFAMEQAKYEATAAANNPLATTQPYDNSSQFNGAGVRNYANFADGVAATILTLNPSAYGGIDYYPTLRRVARDGVIGDNRQTLASEIDAWGTHGFANELRSGWNPISRPANSTSEPAEAPFRPDESDEQSIYNYIDALNTAVTALKHKLASEPSLTQDYS